MKGTCHKVIWSFYALSVDVFQRQIVIGHEIVSENVNVINSWNLSAKTGEILLFFSWFFFKYFLFANVWQKVQLAPFLSSEMGFM